MTKKVVVTDISEKAGEKTVKDFFLFCGKIKEFELYKDESSDKQIAYVTFERDTAAKTALMLTNAVIGDSQITVRSVDDGPGGSDDDDSGYDDSRFNKLAEILASGLILQEHITEIIMEKSQEIDTRFGVIGTLREFLQQLQEHLKKFDQKYQLSETVVTRATDINEKYSVLDHAHYVAEQAYGKVNKLLETSTGRLLHGYLTCTTKQVTDVQYMARQIADNKKQDRNDNSTSSHSHSDEISAQ